MYIISEAAATSLHPLLRYKCRRKFSAGAVKKEPSWWPSPGISSMFPGSVQGHNLNLCRASVDL